MIDPWRYWRRRSGISAVLWPLSWGYCLAIEVRHGLFQTGCLRRHQLPVPVVVVGNVTVGGTGKTPLVIWLCDVLRAAGRQPGIITRGYRRRGRAPLAATPTSDPADVGDEAVLLARRTRVPVMVDADRVRAARRAVAAGCDVVIADDGLQHYRLGRTLEIGVLDGDRRFGNGRCLPSGPLRERLGRWARLDFRVTQGSAAAGEWGMRLEGRQIHAVGGRQVADISDWRRVHAVAGIGNPDRFFSMLRGFGLEVVAHAFPDHHNYVRDDLVFDSPDPVVMTEKDAVKCERFHEPHWWYLPVTAVVDSELAERIVMRLNQIEETHG